MQKEMIDFLSVDLNRMKKHENAIHAVYAAFIMLSCDHSLSHHFLDHQQ